MSPNVTPPKTTPSNAPEDGETSAMGDAMAGLPRPTSALTSVVLTALLAAGVGWLSASTSSAAWDPPAAQLAGGVCSDACGIAACIAFDPDQGSDACLSELHDLNRAGPDPSCVQRCSQQGVPPEVALWLDARNPVQDRLQYTSTP